MSRPTTDTQVRMLDDLALLDAARARAEATPDVLASLVIDELVRRFSPLAMAPDVDPDFYPFPTDDAQLRHFQGA